MGVVYYECQIAYGPVLATNINQFTIIDANAILPIFTGSTLPTTGVGYTMEEFAAHMSAIYGDGYYTMDGIGKNIRAAARYWLPGVNVIFGSVNDALNNNVIPSGNVIWIVIHKMHRVIRCNSDSVFNPSSIYKLNSDGSFSTASGSTGIYSMIPNFTSTGQSFNWRHSYGSTVSDFLNVNNWSGDYSIAPTSTDLTQTRTINYTARPISASGLTALFGDAEEPEAPEPPEPPATDPYSPGGESGPGGGTGTFSETGDTIGIPGLPTLSAVDTGFITLFNPDAAQVKALAAYMWSSSFDLVTFKNIVANPIDCILGLTIVPVNPPNAGSKTVNVGNIPTDVTLPYLSSQYVEVDCGTLNVQEFWGSYLDYSPYTKMSLYLPYIGIVPLDIDDVMNASITVKYHVDVLSGACVAYVLCNGTQLYTYVGQCSSNVPITSNDFTNTVNGILGIAGSIGKLAADGGASAPTEAAGIAANAINALKPNIQKSGAMSGTGGLMGVQTPYLICQRPRQSVPASQNAYTGYPANITAKLSDLSGYTEIDSIHLDGLSATQEEQQEIMDLLTSGVII